MISGYNLVTPKFGEGDAVVTKKSAKIIHFSANLYAIKSCITGLKINFLSRLEGEIWRLSTFWPRIKAVPPVSFNGIKLESWIFVSIFSGGHSNSKSIPIPFWFNSYSSPIQLQFQSYSNPITLQFQSYSNSIPLHSNTNPIQSHSDSNPVPF